VTLEVAPPPQTSCPNSCGYHTSDGSGQGCPAGCSGRCRYAKGSIFLPDFQHAETVTLEVEGKEPEVIRCPVDINGFEHEIREVSRCVKQGRTGSDRYTPQDSLALTRPDV